MEARDPNSVHDPDSKVAKRRCTWEEAVYEVQRGTSGIKRTREQELLYENELYKTKLEWDSLDSYCKHSFLHCPYRTKIMQTNAEKRNRVVKFVVDEDLSPALTFCRNNFPYHLDEDVRHYVIWSTRQLNPDECKVIVDLHFPLCKHDVIIVESPQIYKSVQTTQHVHVMMRPRKTGLCLVKLNNHSEETTYR